MFERPNDCPMRHDNGNCLPCGGFCTSVNMPICEALYNAYKIGKENIKRDFAEHSVLAKTLIPLINKSTNVVVVGHRCADHDCVASSVAVARLAKYFGKPVNIVVNTCDCNFRTIFSSFQGNREYTDLFVNSENAVSLMNDGTLLVACDVNDEKLFEVPELYDVASKVAIIDHHKKTADFVNKPDMVYIDPEVSSVSELMGEVLKYILEPGELPAVEANLILSGIILDTRQFTKNTDIQTFDIASYLRYEGASHYEAQQLFRTSIEDFKREVRFENSVQIYRDHIAISTYEGEATNDDRVAAAKTADRLLAIDGISASFVLCTIDDEISVSARSDGSMDVRFILETLGGGGHFDAAGAQIKGMTMERVLEKLKRLIDEKLEEIKEENKGE